MKHGHRKNPLLYTKEGELSLGPLMLVAAGIQGSFLMIAEGYGWAPHISWHAWAFWGSYVTMTFIAGAAVDRARLIAKSDTPKETGDAIDKTAPKERE